MRGCFVVVTSEVAFDQFHGLVRNGPADARKDQQLGGLEPFVRCDVSDEDSQDVVGRPEHATCLDYLLHGGDCRLEVFEGSLPIHGRTAWPDDVLAGHLFGPVYVSPTLCDRLNRIAQQPHVAARWLTSWSAELRAAMDPFPGRTWPQITERPEDPDLDWWKWAALLRSLDDHDTIRRLAWCDDHLTTNHLLELRDPDDAPPPQDALLRGAPYGLAVIRKALARRGLPAVLIAPETSRGLTPSAVAELERFLARA